MRRWLLLALLSASPLSAQHALNPPGQGGPYDSRVPRPSAALGYELGERFTPHHMIVRYAEVVAEASPRVRLDTVAHSYEGRELLLVTITSEANQARLQEIIRLNERLADPRGASRAELDAAIARTPAIAWLGYTIHGNEASGVEAALATIYELAAGQDETTRMVLDSVVTLIDPVQNPDGHERHVQDVMRMRGVFGPDPYPGAMVNEGSWPGARTSHYLFDLNRDWFLHTHPETRGRMATFRLWHPHVAVDLHEMGSGSTYFFSPPMEPVNENVPESIRRWWGIFARGNADALAARGWGFFTREGYDEFYPGYGISWPVLTGAVGMTYEQASSQGGAVRRDDGSIITLHEAAAHHYTAGLATLRTVARLRTDRVRDFLAFRRTTIEEHARGPIRSILLAPDGDGRADSLLRVLRGNDIEVGVLTEPREIRNATRYGEDRAARVRLPAGTYVIDLAQPQGRLAKAILEPDARLDSTFIREELEARRTGRSDRFYDVTAWSLPYTYRVPAWWTSDEVQARPLPDPGSGDVVAMASAPPTRAGYAYAFAPGSERSLRMLSGLLADSVRVRYAPRPFRVGGASFPGGAFVVLVDRNDGRRFDLDGAEVDIHDAVRTHATRSGARVTPINTALVDEGTDLGSNSVEAVRIPRVALIGGPGVSSYSFGAAWYAFDQLLGLPVTRVPLGELDDAIEDFDTIVLPSAFGLGGALGEGGVAALGRWVRGGGTLITVDGSTAWVTSEDAGLSDFRLRPDTARADDAPGAPLPASVPGAIVRAVADTLSPLMAGIPDRELPVLLSGARIYEAPEDVRPGEVVLRYADLPRLRLAGYMWPEVPARVAGTPYLWTERVGSGRVIAFAGDPNFRAMYRGLLPVFANAVLLGAF